MELKDKSDAELVEALRVAQANPAASVATGSAQTAPLNFDWRSIVLEVLRRLLERSTK